MNVGLKFEGIAELEREMRQIPSRMRRNAYKTGMRAAGRVAVNGAKQLLDAQGVKDTGQLRKSIGAKVSRQGTAVSVGARTGFAVPAPPGRKTKSGMIDPQKYAHLVELGTSRAAAKPFLRPGMDNNSDRMMRALAQGISKGMDRIIQRQMRRKR